MKDRQAIRTGDRLMPDRVKKLHQCIARFERLIDDGASDELALVYQAEIAADRALLAEAEVERARVTIS
jgi:hypothetical protein